MGQDREAGETLGPDVFEGGVDLMDDCERGGKFHFQAVYYSNSREEGDAISG